MVRPSFPSRFLGLVASVVCALFGQVLSLDVEAQTPTAEQIEIFRDLPPEQQQTILESMGAVETALRQVRRFARTVR